MTQHDRKKGPTRIANSTKTAVNRAQNTQCFLVTSAKGPNLIRYIFCHVRGRKFNSPDLTGRAMTFIFFQHQLYSTLFLRSPNNILSNKPLPTSHTHERWHYPKNNSNKNRKNGGNQPFFSSKINNPTQEPRKPSGYTRVSLC